jgi:glycosyltransferase involved in cell wall biosynthesis
VEIYHAQPRLLEALSREWGPSWVDDDARAERHIHRIALTTWETDTFPDIYAAALATYDGVIVPSDFCADVLGAHHIVQFLPRVVPHCFDEGFWPKPQPHATGLERPYRFYTIGAWGERKNSLGILRAYLHAFTKSDNVELMMCISDADFDEIRSVIARTGIPEDQLPSIHVPVMTNGISLSEEQLVELHQTADCFVTATRCEGFGLGMFEAAISGRYVIAPTFGGHVDFLEDYAGFMPIRAQLTPCVGVERKELARDGYQISRVTMPPGVTGKHLWADPDLSDLSDRMRTLYLSATPNTNIYGDDVDWREQRAALEKRFGYKVVGPQLAQTIKEMTRWESKPH